MELSFKDFKCNIQVKGLEIVSLSSDTNYVVSQKINKIAQAVFKKEPITIEIYKNYSLIKTEKVDQKVHDLAFSIIEDIQDDSHCVSGLKFLDASSQNEFVPFDQVKIDQAKLKPFMDQLAKRDPSHHHDINHYTSYNQALRAAPNDQQAIKKYHEIIQTLNQAPLFLQQWGAFLKLQNTPVSALSKKDKFQALYFIMEAERYAHSVSTRLFYHRLRGILTQGLPQDEQEQLKPALQELGLS